MANLNPFLFLLAAAGSKVLIIGTHWLTTFRKSDQMSCSGHLNNLNSAAGPPSMWMLS